MIELLEPFMNGIMGFFALLISGAAVYFAGNKSGKSKVLIEMEKENAKSATEAKDRLVDITGADDVEFIKQLRDSQG